MEWRILFGDPFVFVVDSDNHTRWLAGAKWRTIRHVEPVEATKKLGDHHSPAQALSHNQRGKAARSGNTRDEANGKRHTHPNIFCPQKRTPIPCSPLHENRIAWLVLVAMKPQTEPPGAYDIIVSCYQWSDRIIYSVPSRDLIPHIAVYTTRRLLSNVSVDLTVRRCFTPYFFIVFRWIQPMDYMLS